MPETDYKKMIADYRQEISNLNDKIEKLKTPKRFTTSQERSFNQQRIDMLYEMRSDVEYSLRQLLLYVSHTHWR